MTGYDNGLPKQKKKALPQPMTPSTLAPVQQED